LEWNTKFELGHAQLDGDHRTLFQVLETLSGGYCDHDLVDTQIKILEHYVRDHFTLEERLMADSAYPHLEEHRALHTEFRATVARLRNHWHNNESPSVQREIIAELSDWLGQHIIDADRAYLPWITTKLGPSSVG
jgi:hemerythrin